MAKQIICRSLLMDDEISDFQQMLGSLTSEKVAASLDCKSWSVEPTTKFSVKSRSKHLAASSPMLNEVYSALWKSKCPKSINVLIWVTFKKGRCSLHMCNGLLNCSEVFQRMKP